jgi:hypothetical protein
MTEREAMAQTLKELKQQEKEDDEKISHYIQ